MVGARPRRSNSASSAEDGEHMDSHSDIDIEKQEEELQHERIEYETVVVPSELPAEASKEAEGGRASEEQDSGEDEEQAASTGGSARGRLSGVLSRMVSRTSTKSSWNPGPPPDGGLRAWLAVLAGHLVIMNTWGFVNSFGLFQSYYTTTLARPPSDIAWIGSFQVFLMFFIGTFTGRLTDAGYFRPVFTVGALLQIAAIFATAQGTLYWHFFLTQGIAMGLASGCLFCPTMATLSTYWARRRAFAIGIAACGSATGGLIFPGMVRQLLPSVGFVWTMRALGFVEVLTMAVAWLCIRSRIPPRRNGMIVEWVAFKETEYTLYACGSFFSFWGVYIVFFYLASFARDTIGVSYTSSLDLLLVVNGVGAIGRVIPNYLADRLGAINMFIICGFIAGLTALCWMAVGATAGLYVWTVFYGIAAGGIQSLFPAALTTLTDDLRKAGVRMGMVFTINGFATLTGPPIAGAIVGSMGGRYTGAQAFAGTTLIVGCGFMVASRLVRGKRLGLGPWSKV